MPAEIEIPFYFSMKGLASENPAFLSKQLRRLRVRCWIFKKERLCRLPDGAQSACENFRSRVDFPVRGMLNAVY